MTTRERIFPTTPAAALKRWDAGQSVFTVEMGGLGPGYEQCIHIVVFELIRWSLKNPKVPRVNGKNSWSDEFFAAVNSAEKKFDLGLSGAQAGAAMGLANKYLCEGYAAMLEKMGLERLIQVSKKFPR